jgi:ribosomal protein S18 acetylase RimI-like enzyme
MTGGAAAAPRLRPGRPDDVPGFLRLKERLRLEAGAGGASPRGGFLLGTTPEHYAALIAHAQVHVLAEGDRVVGFVTCLPDAVLRQTEVWAKRAQIAWGAGFENALAELGPRPVGYVDQLALDPAARLRAYGPALAYYAIGRLFEAGAELAFTTVVEAPVRNLASLALLDAAGAERVGTLDEIYPELGPGGGRVTSAVYRLFRSDFVGRASGGRHARAAARLAAMVARLGG